MPLEPVEVARKAVEVASDKQATDIIMLDIRRLCSFADYFVICSAETERQSRTIREDIDRALDAAGVRMWHREGDEASGWVLLDYGDVIIHVLAPRQREYYQLEELWAGGIPVLRVQ